MAPDDLDAVIRAGMDAMADEAKLRGLEPLFVIAASENEDMPQLMTNLTNSSLLAFLQFLVANHDNSVTHEEDLP